MKIGLGSGSTMPTGGVTIRYNTMFDNPGPSNVQLSYGATNNLIEGNIFDTVTSGLRERDSLRARRHGERRTRQRRFPFDAVLDAGPGLADGGGNLHIDPQLDATTVRRTPAPRPTNRDAGKAESSVSSHPRTDFDQQSRGPCALNPHRQRSWIPMQAIGHRERLAEAGAWR